MEVLPLFGSSDSCRSDSGVYHNFFKMRQEKKTTKRPVRFKFRGYTTPGVFPLFEVEDGAEKAIIIFKEDNDYFLESFKLFYDFLIQTNLMELHLTVAKLYFKMLEATSAGAPLFDNDDEQYEYHSLIEFLAKLSVEHRQSIVNKNIAMRTSLNEQSAIMRKLIDRKGKNKSIN